jgi:nucleoprotein TPR
MVRDAGEKYGVLELQLETVKSEHNLELQGRADSISALKKELEDANRLIKTVKDKGLTEDAIEHLSPSAAQASRLLKSGITLTGIYSQMVSLSEELTSEKEENKRLNSYMDQILMEIEERAPILRQQREDYEQAISALGGLTENLEGAREEVELRRREAEEARRNLSSVEKDRDRLEQQVSDLGRQISVLVREVESARAGVQSFDPIQSMDTSSTESVIEGRLLSFRDISELQKRNIELLAVVRDLGSNRDQAESALVQEKTAEVRCELESALRQVDELKSARERQQLMVENIIQQRDLYKSMCGAEKESSARKPETVSEGPNQKTVLLEKQLEEVRKDFKEYKEEKIENYKMVEKE